MFLDSADMGAYVAQSQRKEAYWITRVMHVLIIPSISSPH